METEWISVDERLPEVKYEHNDMVYVLMAMGHNVRDGCYIKYDDEKVGSFHWSETNEMHDVTEHVTHWMPLPKPPKTEEK